MTFRPKHTYRQLDEQEASKLNDDLAQLYKSRVEGYFHREQSSTAIAVFPYQAIETGEVTFSANGSNTVTRSFGFHDAYGKICAYNAHARSVGITAHVVDITSTGITIECKSVSASSFSSVTNSPIAVSYYVVGANP
jgi:hypothetical protein